MISIIKWIIILLFYVIKTNSRTMHPLGLMQNTDTDIDSTISDNSAHQHNHLKRSHLHNWDWYGLIKKRLSLKEHFLAALHEDLYHKNHRPHISHYDTVLLPTMHVNVSRIKVIKSGRYKPEYEQRPLLKITTLEPPKILLHTDNPNVSDHTYEVYEQVDESVDDVTKTSIIFPKLLIENNNFKEIETTSAFPVKSDANNAKDADKLFITQSQNNQYSGNVRDSNQEAVTPFRIQLLKVDHQEITTEQSSSKDEIDKFQQRNQTDTTLSFKLITALPKTEQVEPVKINEKSTTKPTASSRINELNNVVKQTGVTKSEAFYTSNLEKNDSGKIQLVDEQQKPTASEEQYIENAEKLLTVIDEKQLQIDTTTKETGSFVTINEKNVSQLNQQQVEESDNFKNEQTTVHAKATVTDAMITSYKEKEILQNDQQEETAQEYRKIIEKLIETTERESLEETDSLKNIATGETSDEDKSDINFIKSDEEDAFFSNPAKLEATTLGNYQKRGRQLITKNEETQLVSPYLMKQLKEKRRSDIEISDEDKLDNIELTPNTLLQIIPVIVFDLRNDSISPEDIKALSKTYGKHWPSILKLADRNDLDFEKITEDSKRLSDEFHSFQMKNLEQRKERSLDYSEVLTDYIHEGDSHDYTYYDDDSAQSPDVSDLIHTAKAHEDWKAGRI